MTLITLAAQACAQPFCEPASRLIEIETSQIEIKDESNICVSVHVDGRIWRQTGLADPDSDLSRVLASQLLLIHQRQGGNAIIPGPRREPRFVNDYNERNSLCEDSAEDIHIRAKYLPLPDGAPFVFTSRIQQGNYSYSSSASRNVEAEWESGKLVRFAKSNPLANVIADDLRDRAETIFIRMDVAAHR